MAWKAERYPRHFGSDEEVSAFQGGGCPLFDKGVYHGADNEVKNK